MNRLSTADRARIVSMLVEGTSLRAISRITGASINTVTKLLVDAGNACAAFHHEHVRNVRARRVQADEIWAFTYAKQKNVEAAKKAPGRCGRHVDVDRDRRRLEADHFVAGGAARRGSRPTTS